MGESVCMAPKDPDFRPDFVAVTSLLGVYSFNLDRTIQQ